ncbi:hypothetical protein [Arenibaculum sp.]|jgi:hypothetical protein|uniref:hypothetical protein n=1 Tax=Arenibaculum sp. TaxID=2865862 RepID=UPI002E144F62|nr:hypothetical protein [Arenibaculum sp.]
MDTAMNTMPQERRSTSKAMDYALETVQALGEAGLTTVPVKPSAAMLTAGARAGQVSVETVWKIYQAMLHEES